MEGYEGVKELVGFIVWKDTERVKGFKVRFLDIEYILCMCAMRTHTHKPHATHTCTHGIGDKNRKIKCNICLFTRFQNVLTSLETPPVENSNRLESSLASINTTLYII